MPSQQSVECETYASVASMALAWHLMSDVHAYRTDTQKNEWMTIKYNKLRIYVHGGSVNYGHALVGTTRGRCLALSLCQTSLSHPR